MRSLSRHQLKQRPRVQQPARHQRPRVCQSLKPATQSRAAHLASWPTSTLSNHQTLDDALPTHNVMLWRVAFGGSAQALVGDLARAVAPLHPGQGSSQPSAAAAAHARYRQHRRGAPCRDAAKASPDLLALHSPATWVERSARTSSPHRLAEASPSRRHSRRPVGNRLW
jgi:hypothetical protein